MSMSHLIHSYSLKFNVKRFDMLSNLVFTHFLHNWFCYNLSIGFTTKPKTWEKKMNQDSIMGLWHTPTNVEVQGPTLLNGFPTLGVGVLQCSNFIFLSENNKQHSNWASFMLLKMFWNVTVKNGFHILHSKI
jgi:hypothetical protein